MKVVIVEDDEGSKTRTPIRLTVGMDAWSSADRREFCQRLLEAVDLARNDRGNKIGLLPWIFWFAPAPSFGETEIVVDSFRGIAAMTTVMPQDLRFREKSSAAMKVRNMRCRLRWKRRRGTAKPHEFAEEAASLAGAEDRDQADQPDVIDRDDSAGARPDEDSAGLQVGDDQPFQVSPADLQQDDPRMKDEQPDVNARNDSSGVRSDDVSADLSDGDDQPNPFYPEDGQHDDLQVKDDLPEEERSDPIAHEVENQPIPSLDNPAPEDYPVQEKTGEPPPELKKGMLRRFISWLLDG
jgi:hypothetical protein